jgi:hypothetical protein
MAANRYTRIADLSGAAHDEAAELLDALHTAAIERAKSAPANARKIAARAADETCVGLTNHVIAAYRALLEAIGALVAAEGNALYADTERAFRGRVVFHAAAEDASIDWATQRKRQRLSPQPDPTVPPPR